MEDRGLFSINNEGLLIINKLDVRQIKEFRSILMKDKSVKKTYAFKEFMYVYHMADNKSIYRDLGKDEKKIRAKKEAKLDPKWVEDNLVKEAILQYPVIMGYTGSEFAYINASRGMYSVGKDLELFNKANARFRKRITDIEFEIEDGESLTPDELESKEDQLNKYTEYLSKNTQQVVKLSGLLPKQYQALDDLYDKMMKDQEGKKKIFGGGEVNNRED